MAGEWGEPDWGEELRKQIEEGMPILAWQTKQMYQVMAGFLDVFSDAPGIVQGVVHQILTPPGWWFGPLLNPSLKL